MGFEPTTSSATNWRSNQLSYARHNIRVLTGKFRTVKQIYEQFVKKALLCMMWWLETLCLIDNMKGTDHGALHMNLLT